MQTDGNVSTISTSVKQLRVLFLQLPAGVLPYKHSQEFSSLLTVSFNFNNLGCD